MNYDKILANIFFCDDFQLNKSNLAKYKRHYKKKDKYANIINYIEHRYNDSDSFRESIYRIKYNIEIRPVCKECGNKVKFVGKGKKIFAQFCSLSCSNKNKDSIVKKHNSDRLKNNGRLGWNYNTESKKNHRKSTLIKKYGDWKKACKIIEDRHQRGVFDKYGVNNVMKLDSVQIKRNQTLKANQTIGTSNEENIAYQLLKEKFPSIVRHYSSKYYKWNCDFYIPEIDLYIEYQGSHFHNYRPYLNTESDILEKNLMIKKSENIKMSKGVKRTQYDMIVYTWTDLDVRKRNEAKKNNLNFIELWNINDVKSFVKEIDDVLWKTVNDILYIKSNESFISNHKHLNVFNPMQIEEYKNKQIKSCENTKWGTSKEEQKLYKYICEKYPNSKLHYSDDRYPFKCDFYIPELDMFIEYNGYPTHGNHPYNKDDQNDVILSKSIKDKFGSNKTFTIYDPYKRKIAEINNLNFIELWSFKEAKDFIDKLKTKVED